MMLKDSLLFSQSWKQTKVSPFHKGGAKDELNSYRPISILPSLSKLLEKLYKKHFLSLSYLDSFDLIHRSQSGFRAGHSIETALLLMTERWLKALNEGNVVGSVMVDIRKTFDLVDHAFLLENSNVIKLATKFFI